MPTRFLGCKEFVYQAYYVCAFITAASQVASNRGVREVGVERCAGIGRLDLILYRGDEAAIQKHKQMALLLPRQWIHLSAQKLDTPKSTPSEHPS